MPAYYLPMSHYRANAHALKTRRRAKNFKTVQEVAAQVGCTPKLLSKLEHTPGAPVTEELMCRLADLYGCSLADLALSPLEIQQRHINPTALKRLRKAKGYALADLAALSAMTFSTIWRWEQEPGLSRFDYNHAMSVAAALECQASDFLH